MDSNNPLDAIYAYAENAYIRMQAGDLLLRCIDTGSTKPMQDLVEGLVYAGPKSISALYEILLETGQRRAQIQDDLQRLYGEFQGNLARRGVQLGYILDDALSLTRLSSNGFCELLKQTGISDPDELEQLHQRFEDTQDLMEGLAQNIELLQEIENILRDWVWGLAHQSARAAQPVTRNSRDWPL